jgi:hypothetical protein
MHNFATFPHFVLILTLLLSSPVTPSPRPLRPLPLPPQPPPLPAALASVSTLSFSSVALSPMAHTTTSRRNRPSNSRLDDVTGNFGNCLEYRDSGIHQKSKCSQFNSLLGVWLKEQRARFLFIYFFRMSGSYEYLFWILFFFLYLLSFYLYGILTSG